MFISRKVKIIVWLLFIIIIISVGFFWWLSKNEKNSKMPTDQAQDESTQQQAEREKELKNLDVFLDSARVNDTDLDGLDNETEKKLGTDPQAIDTDNDGLLDADEVNVHKTNPLKADTDGDGRSDGYEVRRGYNPLKK